MKVRHVCCLAVKLFEDKNEQTLHSLVKASFMSAENAILKALRAGKAVRSAWDSLFTYKKCTHIFPC